VDLPASGKGHTESPLGTYQPMSSQPPHAGCQLIRGVNETAQQLTQVSTQTPKSIREMYMAQGEGCLKQKFRLHLQRLCPISRCQFYEMSAICTSIIHTIWRPETWLSGRVPAYVQNIPVKQLPESSVLKFLIINYHPGSLNCKLVKFYLKRRSIVL
jgi:hypothetical protein